MPNLPSFKDKDLLLCALTHRSYINENQEATQDNERLEFLGDAILGFVVGELLYQRYPDLSEAQLTRLRSKLVDETQLGKLAKALKVGELMRLGKGAIKDKGRENPALLSDTLEAIIGAYYLDSGLEEVRKFLRSLFQSILNELVIFEPFSANQSVTVSPSIVDVKNRLQQWSLSTHQQVPEYFLIEEFGLDHAKEFIFGVRINGQIYGKGTGRRKQDATKAAAENALLKLGLVS